MKDCIWLIVTHSGDGNHAFRSLEKVFEYVRRYPERVMTVFQITMMADGPTCFVREYFVGSAR